MKRTVPFAALVLVGSISVASAQESPQVQQAVATCDVLRGTSEYDGCVDKVHRWARAVAAMPRITPGEPDPPLGDPAMIVPSCRAALALCTPDRPCHQKVVASIARGEGCDLDE